MADLFTDHASLTRISRAGVERGGRIRIRRRVTAPSRAQIAIGAEGPDMPTKAASITGTDPSVVMRDWIHHQTGKHMQASAGMDPGLAYYPGLAGQRATVLRAAHLNANGE